MHFYPIKLDACSTESVTGVILHQSVGRISLGVLTRENRISEIRHALVIVNLALLILIPSSFICCARSEEEEEEEKEEDERSLLVGNFFLF